MDLRGCLLAAGDDGLFTVEGAGYIDLPYLDVLPGVRPPSPRYSKYRVPCNMIPSNGTTTRWGMPIPISEISPRQYQKDAFQFAMTAPLGAIIALDVGLGKTLIAAAIAKMLQCRFLICGPLLSSTAWVGPKADPEKHYGLKVAAIRTESPTIEKLPDADGYFINYEILPAWHGWLEAMNFGLIITDETHLLRNVRTSWAQVARKIGRLSCIQRRIALTATPIVNTARDLWTLLDFAQPRMWGSQVDFRRRYCGAVQGEYTNWVDTDETNVAELRERLDRVLIRKSRFDVRKELPTFERRMIQVDEKLLDAEKMKDYRRAAYDIIGVLREKKVIDLSGASLQRVNAMNSALSAAKCAAAISQADWLAHDHGKVVVFCWYQETAKRISEELALLGVTVFGPITSKTPKPKRDKAARAFQDLEVTKPSACLSERETNSRRDEKQLTHCTNDRAAFVATLGTSGMSLNELACAPAVLFVDLWWVPATLLQAEGRIHREGQRADHCFAYYLLAKGSADEIMFKHLEQKARRIQRVTDSTEAQSLCDTLGGPEAGTKTNLQSFVTALAAAEFEV